MIDVSKLYLAEKEKTLILLALDTHIGSMHNAGCFPQAIRIFSDLADRMTQYDAKTAELLSKSVHTFEFIEEEASNAELAEEVLSDVDWQANHAVSMMDDEQVTALYEACVARLVEDHDDEESEEPLELPPTPLELYIGRMHGLNVNVDNPRPCDTEARGYHGA
jgi:glutamyl/glutaminyl-tRNA synthetase